MPNTGNGGTVTLSESGLTLAWTRIGEYQQTRAKLPVDALSDTGFRPHIVDDHADPGEIELEAYFDPTEDLADISEIPETITVTFPLKNPLWEVPATLVGSGFLIAVGLPELVNGQVTKQKVRIAFDGGAEDPAFSVEEEEAPP